MWQKSPVVDASLQPGDQCSTLGTRAIGLMFRSVYVEDANHPCLPSLKNRDGQQFTQPPGVILVYTKR